MIWIRREGVYGKCGGRWYLGGTGYFVEHCGHPTALWPYTGVRPDGSTVTGPCGKLTFGKLAECQAAVEQAMLRNVPTWSSGTRAKQEGKDLAAVVSRLSNEALTKLLRRLRYCPSESHVVAAEMDRRGLAVSSKAARGQLSLFPSAGPAAAGPESAFESQETAAGAGSPGAGCVAG